MNWLTITGVLGFLAALLTGAGEFLLLYSPEFNHGPANDFANFLQPSANDLHRGFYLSAIGAPFYIAGYWHIVGMLKLQRHWHGWLLFAVAVFGFMCGVVWLVSNAYQGLLVQTINGIPEAAKSISTAKGSLLTDLKQLQTTFYDLSAPLLTVIRFAIIASSVIFTVYVLRGRTHYPRWFGLFPPLVWILAVFSTLVFLPRLAVVIVPAALNVAHAGFFLVSTLFAWRVSVASQ